MLEYWFTLLFAPLMVRLFGFWGYVMGFALMIILVVATMFSVAIGLGLLLGNFLVKPFAELITSLYGAEVTVMILWHLAVIGITVAITVALLFPKLKPWLWRSYQEYLQREGKKE